ncbi:UDP-glycosyltransferase 74E1-like [Tasmannia lanceolata]|uniref:UDP-glycosyltransferase 74E1-like n=1 Tax=Tasmannia lanceolata TaxID=3420 RepID=UPI004064B262
MNQEEMENNAHRPHVLVLPFPAQGHMNPETQFAKRLAYKGPKVTVATTVLFEHKETQVGSIKIENICNVEDFVANSTSTEAYFRGIKAIISPALEEFIEKHENSGDAFCCLIYDSLIPWCLDVAKQFGLYGVPFLTQPCCVDAIYYHVHHKLLTAPLEVTTVSLPGLPEFEVSELPSFLSKPEVYPGSLGTLVNQFSNLEKADWVLINTFDKLEAELVSWMKGLYPLKTIGPCVPSMYIDKIIENDKDYGLSFWIPKADTCMKWLDTKPIGSVVYVSMGSLSTLEPEHMEELAWALKGSDNYFLWVVRAEEENKLPNNFLEDTTEKGLIVNWCPQLEVLAHKAVGCFVTHCGWNSTVEALSLGVPMVAIPLWGDQPTNAKYVEEVWGAGVRAKVDDEGIVRREEMKICIREIMEGDKGIEIKRNAGKWRELATEALEIGGSSNKNIEDFVATLSTK